MYFSGALSAALFITISEAARLTNSAQDFSGVTAGKPFTISWSDANGPVTLLLKNGPSNNLNTVSTIASGQTGTSYLWTPDSTLPSGTYAIEIDDSNGPNYSVQFPISGSSGSPAPTSTSQSSAYSYTSYYPSYSSGYSSYTSGTPNITSAYTSSAYATTSYASVYPTNSANFTTQAPTSSTTSPVTIPSDTNNAAGLTSPLALVMVIFAAFMFQ